MVEWVESRIVLGVAEEEGGAEDLILRAPILKVSVCIVLPFYVAVIVFTEVASHTYVFNHSTSGEENYAIAVYLGTLKFNHNILLSA